MNLILSNFSQILSEAFNPVKLEIGESSQLSVRERERRWGPIRGKRETTDEKVRGETFIARVSDVRLGEGEERMKEKKEGGR